MDAQTLNAEGTHEKFLYLNTGTWTKHTISLVEAAQTGKAFSDGSLSAKTGIVRCAGSGENLSIKYFEDWHDALIA
jgi:hypothetical protein